MIETTSFVEGHGKTCEDRVSILRDDSRVVIVLADGAGGTSSGEFAAECIIRHVCSEYKAANSANDWVDLLSRIDQQIPQGESTAVVLDVRPFGIAGASVGDSQAWIIHAGEIADLTLNQVRKPLLGSGLAHPMGFSYPSLQGLLLAGTDGLFNYAKPEDLARLASRSEFYELPRKCVDLVRLPSGELWDDVGIAVARSKPNPRTRRRYEI